MLPFNRLYEIKEMLIKLDGLKEEDIKILVEEKYNIIVCPRIKPETYKVLSSYGYGIVQKFNKLGDTIEYYIHVRS